MQISDFLAPDRVILDLRARDKAQLISEIARLFSLSVTGLKPEVVEAGLAAREQLGSTGLGNGFALPHARFEKLDGCYGLFARLAKAIAYDSIDGRPVLLVFALLMPAQDASDVAALAAVARRFRDDDFVTRMHRAGTPAEAYGFLIKS